MTKEGREHAGAREVHGPPGAADAFKEEPTQAPTTVVAPAIRAPRARRMKVADRSNIRSKAKNLVGDMTVFPFCWNLPGIERLTYLDDA